MSSYLRLIGFDKFARSGGVKGEKSSNHSQYGYRRVNFVTQRGCGGFFVSEIICQSQAN
jgi:hypothetical protein